MMNSDLKTTEELIASIDPAAPVPEDGDLRQFAYIAKMRRFVAEKAEMMRRPLTACVVTFGCQMNAERETVETA